jgi:hypothetical protein
MDQEITMKMPQFWENPTAMYQLLISAGDADKEEIKEMIGCDCFDNMMDAKYNIKFKCLHFIRSFFSF